VGSSKKKKGQKREAYYFARREWEERPFAGNSGVVDGEILDAGKGDSDVGRNAALRA
jgi:hypothetical protein